MRIFWCFLYIFALNGLIMGSMESVIETKGDDFFTEIFGKMGKFVPIVFGMSLMMLIRESYKEIKGLIFGVLFVVSLLAYMVLTGIFVK